ncbi:MAG: hypothetical protein QHH24_03285 [Candidatus Bathyarchaeota archaeon]|nr:hypothetical protein [Candidatus Bathyarchaeota archaeon]
MKLGNLIVAMLHTLRLLFTMFALWLTFGWTVRKTRRAFEKELVRQGMSRKDAHRLSHQYEELKREVMSVFMFSYRGHR